MTSWSTQTNTAASAPTEPLSQLQKGVDRASVVFRQWLSRRLSLSCDHGSRGRDGPTSIEAEDDMGLWAPVPDDGSDSADGDPQV